MPSLSKRSARTKELISKLRNAVASFPDAGYCFVVYGRCRQLSATASVYAHCLRSIALTILSIIESYFEVRILIKLEWSRADKLMRKFLNFIENNSFIKLKKHFVILNERELREVAIDKVFNQSWLSGCLNLVVLIDAHSSE